VLQQTNYLFCGNFSTLVKCHICLFGLVYTEKETEKTPPPPKKKKKNTKKTHVHKKKENPNQKKRKEQQQKNPRALHCTKIRAIKIHILSWNQRMWSCD